MRVYTSRPFMIDVVLSVWAPSSLVSTKKQNKTRTGIKLFNSLKGLLHFLLLVQEEGVGLGIIEQKEGLQRMNREFGKILSEIE
mmetsp:Transcript_27096/g.31275  ORF Transcript_27096/g.31275 Transcript_27096/m.31275 type:complete len:84 (+) Transcript_27096:2609-2860(+)